MNDMENGLVDKAFACPKCNERQADELVWIMDHVVKCSKCGTEYNPTTGALYDIGPYPNLDILHEDHEGE